LRAREREREGLNGWKIDKNVHKRAYQSFMKQIYVRFLCWAKRELRFLCFFFAFCLPQCRRRDGGLGTASFRKSLKNRSLSLSRARSLTNTVTCALFDKIIQKIKTVSMNATSSN
jgi:hypothetical protein